MVYYSYLTENFPDKFMLFIKSICMNLKIMKLLLYFIDFLNRDKNFEIFNNSNNI